MTNKSFGHGALLTKSSKKKPNTKSSTEANLVRIIEYLLYNIWMTIFGTPGDNTRQDILYQDNQRTICMEINGRNSCTGNSRYIDIKSFFS